MSKPRPLDELPLGIGYYTVPEAARLLRLPQANIRRWLGGYTFTSRTGERRSVPPLWTTQIPAFEKRIELGFRDLIELRFISAFLDAGLGILTIRQCLDHARTLVRDERPFSTQSFRTDGKTIFFKFVERVVANEIHTEIPSDERQQLIDLKNKQYVFHEMIAQTFKDVDLDDNAVARWRPFHGKNSIIIDPARAFGQPIATASGVPTATLARAFCAEGSAKRVAFLYDVPLAIVRDAVEFESELAAA
jgi:uncharacterized protein (DUF433 family)/DNA-binding transcriptional MerR regulator